MFAGCRCALAGWWIYEVPPINGKVMSSLSEQDAEGMNNIREAKMQSLLIRGA